MYYGTQYNDEGGIRSFSRRMFTLKPLSVIHAEENTQELERTLGLWDLVAIGVGGTLGSGVFVMCGLIAGDNAGPAGVISWLIAGLGCLLSGLVFAELSSIIPSAGSCYSFTYVALGELPAVIISWCLSLEYGLGAAAIARNWGSKVSLYLEEWGFDGGSGTLFGYFTYNIFSAILQFACVTIFLCGANVSKFTVNFFCLLKLLLVVFMILTAYSLYNGDNMVPFAPSGLDGILKGSISAFFGYLGFDEVCMLSAEARDPHRTVPLSLMISICLVAVVYGLASISLSGAMPRELIDPDSGFSIAFLDRGLQWAHQMTAIGEIVTLPLVVLVSFIAQPRLFYAMSMDGLLPKFFSEVDRNGTIFKGGLVTGIVCIIISAFVPFNYMDDPISAAVLLTFNAANSSLLVLRFRKGSSLQGYSHALLNENNEHGNGSYSKSCKSHDGCMMQVTALNITGMVSALLCSNLEKFHLFGLLATILATVTFWAIAFNLSRSMGKEASDLVGTYFRVPGVPYVPAAAIWVNWFLLVQLNWIAGVSLLVFLLLGTIHYVLWGVHYSVGNRTGWSHLIRQGSNEGKAIIEMMPDARID